MINKEENPHAPIAAASREKSRRNPIRAFFRLHAASGFPLVPRKRKLVLQTDFVWEIVTNRSRTFRSAITIVGFAPKSCRADRTRKDRIP